MYRLIAMVTFLVACAAHPAVAHPRTVQEHQGFERERVSGVTAPFDRECIEACKENDGECVFDCALTLKKWKQAPSQSAWCHRKGFSCTDTPGTRVEWLGGVRADGTTWRR
jgi:hypothetical protein